MITRSAPNAPVARKARTANSIDATHGGAMLRLAVIMRVEMIGHFGTRRFPNSFMGADVGERVIEIADTEGESDDERMERQRHDARLFRAFAVERIELIGDHLEPVLRRRSGMMHDADV